MPSAPYELHEPIRDLMRKAMNAARGDEDAARTLFSKFIRMDNETLWVFHHCLEAYAIDCLIDEVRDRARQH